MRAEVRRKFNEGLAAAEGFTPTFGVPVTQAFGDIAAEGSSENFSRADHRHGMPDLDSFVLDLETNTMYLNELMNLTAATNIQASGASTTFGGIDDTGHLGGFGTIRVATAAGTIGAYVMVMQTTTNNTTQQLHPWKRTLVFQTRVRPTMTTAQLVSAFCVVGGVRTLATARADQVTDGVYFYLATDVAGVGNWFARATNNSTTTSVDTGRAPIQTGADVEFQNFRIEYDLASNTATFYIGDSTDVDADGNIVMASVASISTNIPDSTRKLGGFGAILTNGVAAARVMAVDYFAITGKRQYTE